MDIIDWTHATAISTDQLPGWIADYLVAHRARDLDAAIGYFAEAGTVTDEGHTYAGRAAIREWLSAAASEYTYTVELTGAFLVDEEHYDALHHLEGNFPGGTADLHFRFTVSNNKIVALVIEP